MKLKNQVVNLDLAKQLKELGVKQESLFYYIVDDLHEGSISLMYMGANGAENGMDISAFTVAELGEMLPYKIYVSAEAFWLGDWKDAKGAWSCAYSAGEQGGGETHTHITDADTEADARAKMLIYLLENKIILN